MRRIVVPLLVLLVAAGLWLWRAPTAAVVELPDDVHVCNANLRWIHTGLMIHQTKAGELPRARGPASLEVLFSSGALADTPENRARLVCSGRGAPSPYSVRDWLAFPLAKLPAGGTQRTSIAACPSSRNHDGRMSVLYSDGSVVTLTLEQELELGRLPAGTTSFAAGPDSPLPELAPLVSVPTPP